MRKTNTQTIGEALKDYIKALNLQGKLKEVEIVNAWEDIVGKMISNSTHQIYIKNRVLFVSLHSSIIRKELSMIKTDLIRRINEHAGTKVINDIVLK
jgi:predicted nucleic acid-binding Zn ribbon protein